MLSVLGTMLSDIDAEWYGLELSKRSKSKPGTVYPILDRLLKADWVERRWEDIDPVAEGRPRRRLYRLTRVGEVAARQAIDEHLVSLGQATSKEAIRPQPRPRLA